MKVSSSSDTTEPEIQRPRGVGIIAMMDAILLGLFPMICAVFGFWMNISFSAAMAFANTIVLIGWYAPLEWFIMNGRPINSDMDFFVGHGLASLAPGFILLAVAVWTWRGKATSRNALISLVVIVSLLSAITVLTIRSFGPFPS